MMMGWEVLLVAALIFGVIWVARGGSFDRLRGGLRDTKTPLEILERRYAEGDITADEYRQRRTDLLGE